MAAALAACMAGGAAGAQDAGEVGKPGWLKRPTGSEMIRYYPADVMDRSISGQATIRCVVRLDTRIENCVVLDEAPWGMGFGEASIRMLTDTARFRPMTVEGKPVAGGQVTIPVRISSPTPSARYVILEPVWERAPSFEDMAAAWPASAGSLEEGVAVLRCALGADGSLDRCIVASARPSASEFGRAALSLSGKFRMKLTPQESARYAQSDVLVSFRFLNPASSAARARTVEKPRWITALRPEAVVAVYPAQAADAGIEAGRATVDCLVGADGRLTDCQVARERPVNLGFGQSALAIAGLMQMNPWTDDGRPVAGARIKLPIDLNYAGGQ
jgi:TonB family protein